MKKYIFTVVLLTFVFSICLNAETVRCKATKGSSPSFHKKEMDLKNKGLRFKIKYFEQFGLADFDVSSLKGKKITSAYFCASPAGGHKFNTNQGTDLAWLSITTVSSPWTQNGACANSSGVRSDWGWKGAKLWDVACGNGNTLRSNGQFKKSGNVHKIKIDNDLVEALVAKAAYGLFIMDGNTSYIMNCRISNPYLEVTVDGTDTSAPAAPASISLKPAPNWATAEYGAFLLTVKPTAGTFSYNISVNGEPVQRWQIPFAKDGKTQTFQIVDQPADTNINVELCAVDGAGNISEPVKASSRTSPKLTVPKLPEVPFKPRAGSAKALGSAKIYAFPEVVEISPTTGKPIFDSNKTMASKNAVWDGSTGTIRLAAAKGEIVSFQLAIDGNINNVKIAVTDLSGPGEISNKEVKIFRNWYVGGQPSALVPYKDSVSCPMSDNGVGSQTHQAVTIDYNIPENTKAGTYSGKVALTSGGNSLALDLKIKVYDVVMSKYVHFNPELNCYGGPGKAGSAQFKDSYRVAHYYRTTINRVPYNQGGRSHEDWTPEIDKSTGKVTNWSRFDNNLGGLCDGSWFADNPRANVPVASLYLPQFEGWPANFRDYYKPGTSLPKKRQKAADQEAERVKHWSKAKPINEAMSPTFKKIFATNVKDFYDHAKEKGWNKTAFQCYLNNKHGYGYTFWTLDEPNIYRDWEAINYFGECWKQGINDPEVYTRKFQEKLYTIGLPEMNRSKPLFLYRGDISRPTFQGNLSDDNMTIVYIGGGGFDKLRMIQNHKIRMPAIMYAYGSANKYKRDNNETAAWCLKAFANEEDGVLPWQSLGRDINNPDNGGKGGNALIINAKSRGFGHAVADVRMAAFRRGAQDCELLRDLQLRKGWSRQHIGMLVSQKVPLQASYKQSFSDEAAATTFGSLSSQGFAEMKEGVLMLLEKTPKGSGYRSTTTTTTTTRPKPTTTVKKEKDDGDAPGFGVIHFTNGKSVTANVVKMQGTNLQYMTADGKTKWVKRSKIKKIDRP